MVPGCNLLIQGDFAFADKSELLQAREALSRLGLTVKALAPDGCTRVSTYVMSEELRDQEFMADPDDKMVLKTLLRRMRCHICRRGFKSTAQLTQHRLVFSFRAHLQYDLS